MNLKELQQTMIMIQHMKPDQLILGNDLIKILLHLEKKNRCHNFIDILEDLPKISKKNLKQIVLN